LTVQGSNDRPVAYDNSSAGTVVEDSPGNITLSATDIDIGDNLTYTLVSSPGYGNVTITNNQILFTPFDNLSSVSSFSDNFTFQVSDGNLTDNATITLTVQGSNDRPVAYDNSSAGTVVEDSPGNITLSATDIDIGDNLTYTLVSSPGYGNVTITNNQILFTPFDNLSSVSSFSDNFTFQVSDGNLTDNATITLLVQGSN
ncbi:MAG: Ig-like domain-containing protein, partial [SAR324 cluster bacterium]|nr:Ig-like domain-containing protein [SAR324 cluster bacterium]